MRANRKFRENKQAEVGIGTMIVFIASVLVAAVASAVIISTSGKLQEKSQRTGDESSKQIASNLRVERIVGERTDAANPVETMHVYLTLAPGASKVDLKQIKCQFRLEQKFTNTGFDPANLGGADGFFIDVTNGAVIRDEDGSIGADPSTDPAALTPGDLVDIKFDVTAAGLDLAMPARTAVGFTLIPEVGASVRTDFTTPESYGTDFFVDLR